MPKKRKKRRRITKKQVRNTKLRDKTVDEVIKEAKSIEKQVRRKSKALAGNIKNIRKTIEALDLVQERFRSFRKEMLNGINETMTEAEAKLLKANIDKTKKIINKQINKDGN